MTSCGEFWLGCVSCSPFSCIKSIPKPTKNYLLWQRSGPKNATSHLFFPWVGSALGLGSLSVSYQHFIFFQPNVIGWIAHTPPNTPLHEKKEPFLPSTPFCWDVAYERRCSRFPVTVTDTLPRLGHHDLDHRLLLHDLDLSGKIDSWSVRSIAHVARYNLHDLGHASWVGSVLYGSCTQV